MRFITESFGCTVRRDEICKGRTLHRQGLRWRGGVGGGKGSGIMQEPLFGVGRMLPVGLGQSVPRRMKAWMCLVPGSDMSPPTKGGYLGECRDCAMLGVACRGLSVVSVPGRHESRLLFPLLGKDRGRDVRPLAMYLPQDHQDLLPLAQVSSIFLLCLGHVYEAISSQHSAPTQVWWAETCGEGPTKSSPGF